ncbi:hydrogenase maturation protease [Ammoniphilus sp. YIM 78166]|uniref:hydrogenase maturation protease n=1 Tax=Ammoniphilus sp. YIM 78166 TaxID=1644106 RepID=UPI001070067F|nr:hydrogenase maturation protease [Ammoniphilus sp. YIM 78166]
MKPILVLGLGNRLMMDDGVGVDIVEALMAEDPIDSRVEYLVGETDLDYCLDAIENRKFVIIIDAVLTGLQPGEVSVLSLSEMAPNKPGLSLHHLHFLYLLHTLDLQKKGVLVGIEPFNIDFYFGLSEAMKLRFECLLHEVRLIVSNQVKKYFETPFI